MMFRRMRIPLWQGKKRCRRCNELMSDNFGDHAIICSKGGKPTKRHNFVRDMIAKMIKAAGYVVETEKKLDEKSGLIPSDICVTDWNGGRNLALDVSIVSCTNKSVVANACTKLHYAGKEAYKRKLLKYKDYDFDSHNTDFVPLIFEEFGAMPPETRKLDLECYLPVSGCSQRC